METATLGEKIARMDELLIGSRLYQKAKSLGPNEVLSGLDTLKVFGHGFLNILRPIHGTKLLLAQYQVTKETRGTSYASFVTGMGTMGRAGLYCFAAVELTSLYNQYAPALFDSIQGVL